MCVWVGGCVCVGVGACVRVCVGVFIFCNNVLDILEGYGSTTLCCEYYIGCFCEVLSSPFLKMSYFTSTDEPPAVDKLGKKQYDILHQQKVIYIDIGYRSVSL